MSIKKLLAAGAESVAGTLYYKHKDIGQYTALGLILNADGEALAAELDNPTPEPEVVVPAPAPTRAKKSKAAAAEPDAPADTGEDLLAGLGLD